MNRADLDAQRALFEVWWETCEITLSDSVHYVAIAAWQAALASQAPVLPIAPIVPVDLDAIEAAARAATPGPWHAQDQHADNGEFSHIGVETGDGEEIIGEEVGPGSRDTRFIAAANPAVVLELIQSLRAAEAALSSQAPPVQQEPFAYVIVDKDSNPEFVTSTMDEAQAHINDAISEHDIDGAGKWRTVPAHAMRPSNDELWDQTIRDRDTYHDWADKLSDSIAKHFNVDIGEHSNLNLPWSEALDAIEAAPSPQGDAEDAQIVNALLGHCHELKLSYNRDNSLKAIRAVFMPSVEASVGYRAAVRKELLGLAAIDAARKAG